MALKVTIIGTGAVGSTIAYALTIKGVASEILLVDINKNRADGEALDIVQGTPFGSPVYVHSGEYEEAAGSDVVIYACGLARKPGQSRLDLAQANVSVCKSVIPQITKAAPDAIYLIVANPVDILTYQFYKTSGLKPEQIIGSGTSLDTSRLCEKIASHYGVSTNNVNAYIFGEHGDSSFSPWSLSTISGISVDKYAEAVKDVKTVANIDHDATEEFIRKSGGWIIERKGATFYAVATAVCYLCEVIESGVEETLAVSTLMNGEYGISDVALSTLCTIGRKGVINKVHAPLTDEEVAKLQKSADALKAVISQLSF